MSGQSGERRSKMREKWIPVDLARFPPNESTAGIDKIGVTVTKNGEDVALSGTVAARMILPDGSMLSEDGTVSGNQAYVVLPDEAYEQHGTVTLSLRLTEDGNTTTLCFVTVAV